MSLTLITVAAAALLLMAGFARAEEPPAPGDWTIYITNDNCPDYTWGLSEKRTRQAFADIVKGHLDEMNRTGDQPDASRNRYNMAVTQEALCFVEHYPDRKDELIRRIREGRMFLSPFLCNSLWGFQSTEGAIRTFYPARRLERDFGIDIDVAEHIECPSLPWGMATILSGCGVRWVSVPYLGYDSTFGGLDCPPLFYLAGPDSSRVGVILDKWASSRSSYTQGGAILRKPDEQIPQWIKHYASLGEAYPLRAILASGTHGDISPGSGGQAKGFAEGIIAWNARGGKRARLRNATLREFCQGVDDAEKARPFLKTLSGSFGHSWELWPTGLAGIVADMRQAERDYLTAEALLARAAVTDGKLAGRTRELREKAEWCWAMLSDHAWNGTGDDNKRLNAELRRRWADTLAEAAGSLRERSGEALGIRPSDDHVVLFNGLSFARKGLVRVSAPEGIEAAYAGDKALPSQVVSEDGERVLYFLSPEIEPFGLAECRLGLAGKAGAKGTALAVTPNGLEGPLYSLAVDPKTGAIASLVHKPSGRQLVPKGQGLCRTVYNDGQDKPLENVKVEAAGVGPVFARLRVTGTIGRIEVVQWITLYAELDRVDIDIRLTKPAHDGKERLCQFFPIADGAVLRAETPLAVLRPLPKPKGDLLPGADRRRLAVQGFIDAAGPEGGMTVASLDAFALRLDLGSPAFEALGNDQNHREVLHDQFGQTQFRVRYAVRGFAGRYDNAASIAWSRAAASRLAVLPGRLDEAKGIAIGVDPSRAVATCLKPADDPEAGGLILRLQEVAGQDGPVRVEVAGFRRAVLTDLLERDRKELPIKDGAVAVEIKPNGLAGLRLVP